MSLLTVAAPGHTRSVKVVEERSTAAFLLSLSCLIFTVKVVLLWSDPYPAFHFGDSGAYLATALAKWIPPDRSFSYGFFLRPLVLDSHSLLLVLMLQTVCSAMASILAGFILVRYLCVRHSWAALLALASAVEPLQLMSERFIMAEALTTFGFALLLWAALEFIKTNKFLPLVCVQVAGVFVVSLRYSMIPLVLLLSLLLPVLAAWRRDAGGKSLAIRLGVAVLASQVLLLGYRHVYGYLAHEPPSYLSRDGEFLVADMAPLVRPSDFPLAEQRKRLNELVTVPYEIDSRRIHRWAPGGLCESILTIANRDEDLANRLAKATALRAIKRDPLGVVRLGIATFAEFLTVRKLEWSLQLNQGHFVDPTDNDAKMIRGWFDVDARNRHFDSLTKRWQGISVPWCWLVVCLPILFSARILANRKHPSPTHWFLFVSALMILLCAIVPVEIANARYLIPLPWLSFLMIGALVPRQSPCQA